MKEMKLTYTVQLNVSSDEMAVLRSTLAEYRAVAQLHSEWGYLFRTRSKRDAHVELYAAVKELYPQLPTALLQAARDVALEALRGCKFRTCPKFDNLQSVRYNKNTMTLRGNQLTLSQCGERLKTTVPMSDYLKEKLAQGTVTSGDLVFKGDGVYFHFNVNIAEGGIIASDQFNGIYGHILGIDLGIIHTAVTSERQFYSGRELRKIRRKHFYQRKLLQQKHTPSSRKRQKLRSGRERRAIKNELHIVTKKLVAEPHGVLAIEDLSKFKSNAYHKKANKIASDFPFYQFKQFLTYKAALARKQVVLVDARFTSQKCSNCGHIYKGNRSKSKFLCVACGFLAHADYNAALNIKYLASSKESGEQGAVNYPYELDVLVQAPGLVPGVS